MKKVILTTAIAIATVFAANAQNKHYITVNGAGTQDGSSWANARAGLQWITTTPGLNGDTIMLQQGVYKQSVTINKRLHIYGGFAGTETNTSQSNPDLYPTVFDADVLGNDIPGDYVTNKSDNIAARLFIFTSDVLGNGMVYGITFKNAYLSGTPANGAAVIVYSNSAGNKIITFRRCQFFQNSANTANGGGAIAITAEGGSSAAASAIFDRCWFSGNANRSGSTRGSVASIIGNLGGYAEGLFTNCIFDFNNDMHSTSSEKALIVVANSSNNSAGGAELIMHNNTFVGNYNSVPAYLWNGASSGGMAAFDFTNNINLNSPNGLAIIGDAATANYYYYTNFSNNYGGVSIVNHTTTSPSGVGNIGGSDPLFAIDYELSPTSPCVDAGATSPYAGNYDYADNNRTVGAGMDIGAYEYQGTTASCVITNVFVDNVSACDPIDDTYNVDLTIMYDNPPTSGFLNIYGQNTNITGSPQSVTINSLPADGNFVTVDIYFTEENTCAGSASWTAPPSCGTTEINDLAQSTLLGVYPNPVCTLLNIETRENTNIRIVNLLGATVATQQLQIGNNSIDVSELTNGVYFIHSDKGGAVKFIRE
jgi:hypothetical protein